jgi:hypothetical protein
MGQKGMRIDGWYETHRERDYYEDQDIGGWMDLVELGWGDVGWIDLAQDRDKWTALVNV